MNGSIRPATVTIRMCNSHVFTLSPLLTAYGSMAQSLHRLMDECYLARLVPALATQFTRIDCLLKLFCNQVNNLLLLKNCESKTVFNTAEFLVSEWVDLVGTFNAMAENSISPHIICLTSLFTSLFEYLDHLQDLLKIGTFATLISRHSFRQIRAEAVAMQREVPCHPRQFDDPTFPDRIRQLALRVAAVFHHSVPTCSLATSELMQIRTGVNAAFVEMLHVGRGMVALPELVPLARISIAQASRELDAALESLNIPVGIRLVPDIREPPPTSARTKHSQRQTFVPVSGEQ
jgi:hypothetical protein